MSYFNRDRNVIAGRGKKAPASSPPAAQTALRRGLIVVLLVAAFFAFLPIFKPLIDETYTLFLVLIMFTITVWFGGQYGISFFLVGTLAVNVWRYLNGYQLSSAPSMMIQIGIFIGLALVLDLIVKRYRSMGEQLAEKRRQEADLRTSLEQIRAVLDTTFDGLAITKYGHIVYANVTLQKQLEKELASLMGTQIWTYVSSEDALSLKPAIIDQPSGKRIVRSASPDNNMYFFGWNTIDLGYDNLTMVTLRSLEAEKHSLEAIHQLAGLVERSPEPMVVFDRDVRMVHFNPAAEKIFGPRLRLHPSEMSAVRDVIMHLDQHGRWRGEIEVFGASGKKIPVEVVASKEQPTKDDPPQYQFHFRDISDRREAEQNLLVTLDELDRFAYAVAHDLKAPLRAIIRMAEWVLEDATDALGPQHRDDLQTLIRSATHMRKLIDGILEYARLGRSATVTEDVDTQVLVKEIVDSLDPGHRHEFVIAENLPTIQGHRVLLSQVFSNLITNAINHNDKEQVAIEVGVNEVADQLEFYVRDNGPGIDDKYKERVFGFFQTLQPKQGTANTGIGLSLVKRIVEQWGGEIWISDAKPHGAAFHFSWPLSGPSSETAADIQ